MTERRAVCLIANPAAGRGRGARVLPAIQNALAAAGVTDVRLTTAAGDERRLARDAAAGGVETIIALGGDGTWGNAARGILESGRDARLALLAAGTGNDFGHALGLPVSDLRAMAHIAVGSREMRVDVGCADGASFVNVAGFGVETIVIEASRHVPLLRGHLLYLATAVPQLFTYRALTARIHRDGEDEPIAAPYLALIAANGPRFGGGFHVAPRASLTDGLLDLVSIRDASVVRRAALLARVRMGRHLERPEVELHQVRCAELHFDAPPLMDLDGELVRAQSENVEIRCVSRALRVAVGT